MKAVVQRVSSAKVTSGGEVTGSIQKGLLILLGIASGDTIEDVVWLSGKIANLRIFSDQEDRMNLSVQDCLGEVLVVSQFTLIASTRKGTRPSFNNAAKPEEAVPLYEKFVQELQSSLGRSVATGRFGASMSVELNNDGPVTLVIDSDLKE